jgi:serine/threonine-protein kinase
MLAKKQNLAEAESLVREALAIHRRVVSPGDARLAWDLSNLAAILIQQRKQGGGEVEALVDEAMSIVERLSPEVEEEEPHQSVLVNCLGTMAFYKQRTGDLVQAEKYARSALDVCTSRLGEDHPEMAMALNNLATIRKMRGSMDGVVDMYERSLAISCTISGPRHPDTATALCNLGSALLEEKKPDAAEARFREALEIRRERLPDGHLEIASALSALGKCLVDLDRSVEAEPVLRDALSIREANLPPRDILIGLTRCSLGLCMADLGRLSDAEQFLTDGYRIVSDARGPSHKAAVEAASRMARLCEADGRADEAREWRVKSGSGREL